MEELKEEKVQKRKMRLWVKLLILLFVLIISTILYSRFIGTKGLSVKEYLIVNEKLPESFSGIKIAHISDIHYGQTTDKYALKKLVKSINEYEPDIIVITGDLLDQDVEYTEQDVEDIVYYLLKLNASMGKYIIMGNHDNTKDIYNEIVAKSGFTNLNENYETLYYQSNAPILIAGMSTGEYSNKTPQEKVEDAITNIKLQNINYSILIMHEPDYIEYENFDLVLAGHSHNGQVRFPIIGALILPPHAESYYDEYYQLNNTDLYISSGIGTSRLKFRLFNRPSYNLYRIVNK